MGCWEKINQIADPTPTNITLVVGNDIEGNGADLVLAADEDDVVDGRLGVAGKGRRVAAAAVVLAHVLGLAEAHASALSWGLERHHC